MPHMPACAGPHVSGTRGHMRARVALNLAWLMQALSISHGSCKSSQFGMAGVARMRGSQILHEPARPLKSYMAACQWHANLHATLVSRKPVHAACHGPVARAANANLEVGIVTLAEKSRLALAIMLTSRSALLPMLTWACQCCQCQPRLALAWTGMEGTVVLCNSDGGGDTRRSTPAYHRLSGRKRWHRASSYLSQVAGATRPMCCVGFRQPPFAPHRTTVAKIEATAQTR
jgi:hypothetical protein